MGKNKSYKNRKRKGIRSGLTPIASRPALAPKPEPKKLEVVPFSGFPQIELLNLAFDYCSIMRGVNNVFEPSEALERAVGLTLVNTLLAVPNNIYEPKKEHPRNERLHTTAQLETYQDSIKALELNLDRSWKMSGSDNFIEPKELELKGLKNTDHARTFDLESVVASDFYESQGKYDVVFLDRPEKLKFDYRFLVEAVAEIIFERHQEKISELERSYSVTPTDKKIEALKTFIGIVEKAGLDFNAIVDEGTKLDYDSLMDEEARKDYETVVTAVTEYLGKTEMDEESREVFTHLWDDYQLKETVNRELKEEILKKAEGDNLPESVSQVVERLASNVAENGILITRNYQESCPGFRLIETYSHKDGSISLYQREDSSHNLNQ